MTGNIKDKLSASDAVKSLRMEHDIYYFLKSIGQDPAHSWYYKDGDTGKPREIDIYSRIVLDKPQRYRYMGSPQIALELFIECKSAASHNILISDSSPSDNYSNRLSKDWFGYNHYLYEVSSSTLEEIGINDEIKMMKLYQYFKSRAFPGNREIIFDLELTKPPVDVITTAFRDTKVGSAESEGSYEQVAASPLWNAMRATRSASEAAKVRTREMQLGWIRAHRAKFEGKEGLVENISFFFDAELMRPHYSHAIIFTDSKLWHVKEKDISEVHSARIHINDADHKDFSVDVISASHAKEYLAKTIEHFEKQSRKSIKKMWNTLQVLGWYPASDSQALSIALDIPMKEDKSGDDA